MELIKCECPTCKKQMQFKPVGAARVQIQCPQCSQVFHVEFDTPASIASSPLPPLPARIPSNPPRPASSRPSAGHASPPPAPTGFLGSQDPVSFPGTSQTLPRMQAKKSSKSKRNLIPLAVALVLGVFIAVGLPIVVAAIWRNMNFASALSLDSQQSVLADLQSELTRLESIAKAIPAGDESPQSAAPLMEGVERLEPILKRALALPSHHDDPEEKKEELQASQQDPKPPYWHIDTSKTSKDAVSHAKNIIGTMAFVIPAYMRNGLYDPPDPLVALHERSWTKEQRRLLAIVRISGSMRRDFARALSKVPLDKPTSSSLDALHRVLDSHWKEAEKLRELGGGRQIFVEIPRDGMYLSQQSAAGIGLNYLAEKVNRDTEADAHLKFVLRDYRKVDEAIEGMMFSAMTSLSGTSKERYLAELKIHEDRKQEEVQREQQRVAQEEQRKADEAARAQARAEDLRRREEEFKKLQEEREKLAANAASNRPGPGGRLGFGPNGAQEIPGPNFNRPPNFGPSGTTIPTTPPNFGPPGNPFPGFGPPTNIENTFDVKASLEKDPKRILIDISQAANFNMQQMTESLTAAIPNPSYNMTSSNDKAMIIIWKYDKPLEDISKCLPSLQVVSIDEKTRSVKATLKKD